jgi:hypothetical protein
MIRTALIDCLKSGSLSRSKVVSLDKKLIQHASTLVAQGAFIHSEANKCLWAKDAELSSYKRKRVAKTLDDVMALSKKEKDHAPIL